MQASNYAPKRFRCFVSGGTSCYNRANTTSANWKLQGSVGSRPSSSLDLDGNCTVGINKMLIIRHSRVEAVWLMQGIFAVVNRWRQVLETAISQTYIPKKERKSKKENMTRF